MSEPKYQKLNEWVDPETNLKYMTYLDARCGWCYRIEMILPIINKQIYCVSAFNDEPSQELLKRTSIEHIKRLGKIARLEYYRYCKKTNE